MRNPFARDPAVPAPSLPELPGFFGKVPTIGDFLARRIPKDFAPLWEDWLQVLLVASRQHFGAQWQSAWLEMPVWHFVLGVGVVARHRTYGVLIPSVDRVGREFPLTILSVGREQGVPLSRWALEVEALALASLEDGFTAGGLDGDLSALGAPEDRAAYDGPARTGLTHLQVTGDWPDDVDRAIGTLARGETLWWCRGSARVAPAMLRCIGLPSPEQSARFLGGDAPIAVPSAILPPESLPSETSPSITMPPDILPKEPDTLPEEEGSDPLDALLPR